MARRTAPAPGQFALFGEDDLVPKPQRPERPAQWAGFPDGPDRSDHEPQGWTGPCLYDSPARGLAARIAEMDLWEELYGSFGCACDSHAWRPSLGGRRQGGGLDRHEPIPLDCDLRRHHRHDGTWDPVPPCGHDADAEAHPDLFRGLKHRGACRKTGCDWEGPVRDSENQAVEDGMDHAWPGWRDLPTVPRLPEGAKLYDAVRTSRQSAAHKTFTNWVAKINAVYPPGWLESGGPIRTLRRPMETRHVEAGTPFGGYDLAVPVEAEAAA